MKSNNAFNILKGSQQRANALLLRFAKQLWADDRGQSTTEYILILSVVVMIAMKFKAQFQTSIDKAVGKLGTNIDGFVDSTSSQ